jgi:N-acetylmuramoyl-L-alanine amidase
MKIQLPTHGVHFTGRKSVQPAREPMVSSPVRRSLLVMSGILAAATALTSQVGYKTNGKAPVGKPTLPAVTQPKVQPKQGPAYPNLPQLRSEMKGISVLVDPGHGGEDPGAQNSGLSEKDFNLSVALQVRDRLKAAGLTEVDMTRNTDVGMEPPVRSRIIYDEKKSDLVVSVHTNCTEAKSTPVQGYQVYIRKPEESLLMGRHLRASLRGTFGTKLDMGRFSRRFYMINQPGALVEMGFINNKYDRKRLVNPEWQAKMADAISSGVINYLNEKAFRNHGGDKPSISFLPKAPQKVKPVAAPENS